MVLCRFAVGRIVSLELVITLREATPTVLSNHPPSCTGGVGRSVRCGCQAPPGRPHHVRQRAYCIVKLPSVLYRGGGEKCLQLQVFATRPWCGPRGYIQVGMRGCDCGEGIRAPRGRSPLSMHSLLFWKFCSLSRLPLPGGRMHVAWGLLLCFCSARLNSTCGGGWCGACFVPMTSGVVLCCLLLPGVVDLDDLGHGGAPGRDRDGVVEG